MRGLPPVPSSVGLLTQDWEIGGHFMSTSWWMLLNLPRPLSNLDLSRLLSDYTLFALPNLLSSCTDTLSPTTCRLTIEGLVEQEKNPPAHGAFSSSEPCNTASGITWRTGEGGRRGWALTYLPGCPHDFVESGWQLSAEGWGNILDSAVNFWLQMRTLPSFPPDTVVLGTLHRARSGVPLSAGLFAPFVSVAPAPRVVTIRRRLPKRRAVLPF